MSVVYEGRETMVDFISAHSFVIAQIIGFMAVATVIVMYQFKSHKVMMGIFVFMCTLWCLHFALLGCWSAVAMNAVNVVRSFIYGFRDKKWAQSNAIPAVFCVIAVVMVILTWENAWSLLPFIGGVAATIANWQTDTKKLKILTVPVSASWLIYNAHNVSYAGLINEIFALCSIGVYFIRTRKKKTA